MSPLTLETVLERIRVRNLRRVRGEKLRSFLERAGFTVEFDEERVVISRGGNPVVTNPAVPPARLETPATSFNRQTIVFPEGPMTLAEIWRRVPARPSPCGVLSACCGAPAEASRHFQRYDLFPGRRDRGAPGHEPIWREDVTLADLEWFWLAHLFALEVSAGAAAEFTGIRAPTVYAAYRTLRCALVATFLKPEVWVKLMRMIAVKHVPVDFTDLRRPDRKEERPVVLQRLQTLIAGSPLFRVTFGFKTLELDILPPTARLAALSNSWAGLLAYTYNPRTVTVDLQLSRYCGPYYYLSRTERVRANEWKRENGRRMEKLSRSLVRRKPAWMPRADRKWRWLLQRMFRFTDVPEELLSLHFCELIPRYNCLHGGLQAEPHAMGGCGEPLCFSDYAQAAVFALMQPKYACQDEMARRKTRPLDQSRDDA